MKKRISIIALLLIMVILSSCSSNMPPQPNLVEKAENTPTAPKTSSATPTENPLIKVYSLYPNELMERIITAGFSGAVQFVVGTEEINVQDATRLLATEILAGAGPDVIVMDGLPIDSYAEKGALADLSGILPEQLLPNIRAAYTCADGSVCAIPIKVKVPTLLGEDIDGVETLSDFADLFEENDSFYFYADVLDFYTIFGNRWIQDGALNESAFREDVEAMARLASPLQEMGADISYEGNHADVLPEATSSYWHVSERVAGVITFYGSLRTLGAPYEVIPLHENAQLKPWGDSVFIPCCTLAVNSQGKQIERSMWFVQSCLMSDVQRIDTGDTNADWGQNYGYPVNESVFQMKIGELPNPPEITDTLDPQIDYAGFTIPWDEPWDVRTPTYEEATAFLQSIKTLTTPAPMDYALREIFVTQIQNYLNGTSSMEEIITALNMKLPLYMAE